MRDSVGDIAGEIFVALGVHDADTTTMAAPGEMTIRAQRMRTMAGYGAAVAVTPYLVIKILWAIGLFLPTDEMGEARWRAINATTAVLALIGILLAMAFIKPWGERLPAWTVALPVWVGTGFLVPLLLIAPILGPAAVGRDRDAGAADVWAYEQVLVMISLVGIGVGLPLALAGYTRSRWPEAVSGPLGSDGIPGHTRGLQAFLAMMAAAGSLLLGIVKVYWAAGGTVGLDPARLGDRDVWWHMLSLSTGAWALAGAWGVMALATRRGSRRFLPPMAAAWVSSGMMFAYSVYSLLLSASPDGPPVPEYPVAQAVTLAAGMVLGVVMGIAILLVLHDRRQGRLGR